MKKILVFILFGTMIFASCQKEYEVKESPINGLAGQWWTTFKVGGVDIYGIGYTSLYTYNTASNDGSAMWISDEGATWDYRVKCPVNVSSLTFGAADSLKSVVPGYEIGTIVSNGKIIKDGGRTVSGRVVDSIYFEIQFEDDPGTVYEVGGVAYTGFEEDIP